MKRIALLLVAALAIVATVAAQTPQQVLDKAVAALKAGGNIQASYAITGSQGRSSGTITMNGAKFRLLSNDMKCWYNGSAMWTYSVATGEVNITTPTQQDLQMTNPMAAAEGFKRNFHMWKAKGQIPGNYAIKLMPKSKSEISEVYLYISNGSYRLSSAHFVMSDGSRFTIKLTNYKTGVSAGASTFTFDKSQVPAGTPVVDLR